MLEPDAGRASTLDAAMRSRLADSLEYIDGLLNQRSPGGLEAVASRARIGSLSPFVFCLYGQLVAHVSTRDMESALKTASALERAAATSDAPLLVPYEDSSVPEGWWRAYHALLDTEPGRDFRPVPPSAAGLESFRQQYDVAQEIVAECDGELSQELGHLIRMIVPAAPRDHTPDQRFNGASTFLAWGAVLLNSELKRHPMEMIDLLVHESGHLLLFGLVEGGALTENAPSERYTSPLSQDPRPIDGIFHACFVSTRVHIAMSRLIESGSLDHQSLAVARELANRNGSSAARGLEVLSAHARATAKGQPVLEALNGFWSSGERLMEHSVGR
jgi:HEXXH motif-containing protein